MTEAWIIDACRTPRGIGKAGKGALSSMHPQHLGAAVLKAIAERNKITTANDKRKSVIHLTPLGMDWREVAKTVVIEFTEKIQSHFKKEEMEIFFAILKKINKIIDEAK